MIRLNKLMRLQGLCSRREADRLIAEGLVTVNGRVVKQLGAHVASSEDAQVVLLPRAERQLASQRTIVIHKPLGIVSGQPENGRTPAIQLCTLDRYHHRATPPNRTSSSSSSSRASIRQARRPPPQALSGWAAAGRLDVNSTGLLVLTQSGSIASQLVSHKHEKEYLVRLQSPLFVSVDAIDKLDQLRHGIVHDGDLLQAVSVEPVNQQQLKVVLTHGKHHHIRRMMEAVDWKVQALKRVRMGPIRLGNLPVGCWRYLFPHEETLL